MTSPVLRTFIAAALLGAAALPAHAQSYPTKPVRFIVPFPPGGPVDATARAITFKLSEYWKQQAIVDNRAGAGGIVGAEVAAKSPADGYTVFVCSIHHSVLPSLRSDLSYNIEKDFAPVTFATAFPIILVAHPSVQSKSVKELVAYARANPGKLSYGSAGNGGGTHLAGELFKDIAKVDLLHVPYKGSAPAMTDLLGGQVQLMFSDGPTALPQIKGGKVKAYGVTTKTRVKNMPEIPTLDEAGLKGFEVAVWHGIYAPKGTPKPVVDKLSNALRAALRDERVVARFADLGTEPVSQSDGTPDAHKKKLEAEINRWRPLIQAAGVYAD